MNKLLNTLKAKPKLYKCLKILGVVGICLSLIFNAIIIGSAIAYRYGNNNNNNEVREVNKQQPKGLIDIANQQFFLSSADITWDKFYYGVLHDFDPAWTYEYDSDYLVNYDLTSGIPQIEYINVRYATTDNNGNVLDVSNWQAFALKGITISKDYVSPTYCSYYIDFYWTHSDNSTWHVKYFWRVYHDLQINGSDSKGTVNIEQSYFFRSNVSGDNPLFYMWSLEFTHGYEDYYLVRWFCKNDITYSDGLSDGYYQGYLSGKQVGYEEGYEVGSTGLTNNPFDMLANGFNAMASILDIQILPGLTLGLLVFTPIIIAIVIVIVKIVKG